MRNLELRKPYKLTEIIDFILKDILKNGLTNNDYCLYTKNDEDIAEESLICYLENGPEISDDDEEVFPDFIVKESLELFYDGRQFEDVLMNVHHQKNNATKEDYILSLNYYAEYDTFKDW